MNSGNLSLFLAAALIIAVVPGPGIFYVMGRTLSDGRRVGIASTLGTAMGGSVHILAGALGISAIIFASAQFFAAFKLVGAAYLIWLGIRTFREAGSQLKRLAGPISAARAFREGVLVEALNPKTAAFFLAFIPQFLEPAQGHPAIQFLALGLISVTLNSVADLLVVMMAANAQAKLTRHPIVIRRLRQASGLVMTGFGISLVLARRPVSA